MSAARAARIREALFTGKLPRGRRGNRFDPGAYQVLRCPAGHYHRAFQTVEVAQLFDVQACHLHREAA